MAKLKQGINDRDVESREAKKVKESAFKPSGNTGAIGALANAQPDAIGASVGSDPQATASIGQLASPSGFGREPAASDPSEMEARVSRNEGFLRDPTTKAQLMQFGLSMLSSAGRGNIGANIGNALTSAAQLPARQRMMNLKYNKEVQAMDIAARGQQIDEEKLSMEKTKFGLEIMDKQKELDREAKRAAIMGAAAGDPKDSAVAGAMSDVGLINMAGQLAASGDIEGAKVALDMANARRLAISTPDITEFNAAKADGSIPPEMGLYQYLKQKDASRKSSTTINTAPNKVYEQAVKDTEMADSANQKVAELTTMLEEAKKTPTGWTVPYTLPVRAALQSMGITIDENNETVPLQQIMQSNSAKMALNLRSPEGAFSEGGLTGSTSDRDLRFLLGAVAGLGNTPEANQVMLIAAKAKARRVAEISAARSDFVWENDSLKGWSEEAKKIYNKPLLTEEERTYVDSLYNPERVKPEQPTVGGSPNIKGQEDVPEIAPDYLTQDHKDLWYDADPALRRHYMQTDKKGGK